VLLHELCFLAWFKNETTVFHTNIMLLTSRGAMLNLYMHSCLKCPQMLSQAFCGKTLFYLLLSHRPPNLRKGLPENIRGGCKLEFIQHVNAISHHTWIHARIFIVKVLTYLELRLSCNSFVQVTVFVSTWEIEKLNLKHMLYICDTLPLVH